MNDPFQLLARRQFLINSGAGLGTTALASLLPQNVLASANHTPKAKHVIFLFMAGAPSQIDLFDYKPVLQKHFKKQLPESISMGQRVTAMTRGKERLIAPSVFKFEQKGENGVWFSELLPHLSKFADDLCIVKTLNTHAINHDPAKTFLCTGSENPGRASMGAWLSYGLGSMSKDLPDFIVLTSAYWSGGQFNIQGLYSRLWGSGPLPTKHQGVAFQSSGDPVLFLSNPKGITADIRRVMLDLTGKMNLKHFDEIGDNEINTTIAQQEMAFRMQASVPSLTDISGESKNTMNLYGPEVYRSGSFARNCLLARRMVQKGVRFVQLFHRGWDHHVMLPKQLPGQTFDIDQPLAGLIHDLKSNGLFEDTLLVLAGEFGRTAYCQGKLTSTDYGRDHHPRCFSGILAGGGIKGGISYGETDDFSYNVVDSSVPIRDLHATLLHQLGIDHKKLSFKFQGLDQKLTGVLKAKVVNDVLL